MRKLLKASIGLLALAAAIEQGSHHPLARAVVAAASEQGLTLANARDLRALPGMGVEGRIDGALWQLLAPSRVPALGEALEAQVAALERQGKTVILLCRMGEAPSALLALRDQIRPEAAAALQELKGLGLQSIMLTGDNPRAAEAIAGELGMEWRASLLPEGKVEEIARLAKTRKVAMIGDGINDAPVLARADVSVAVAGGADVAREGADVVLLNDDMAVLPRILKQAQRTRRIIRQNLIWASIYNLIAVPLAVLGFVTPPGSPP